MPRKLFAVSALILVMTALCLNLLSGCADTEEESAVTTTAALPEEELTVTEQDDSFVVNVYKTYAAIAFYRGGGATVAIPSAWNGLPVLGIEENAFASNAVVTNVILPGSVIDIANGAFRGCRALRTVTMPGVKAIGVGAFRDSALSEVTLPDCLENLGQYAFAGTAIRTLDLRGKIPIVGDYAFSYCAQLESVTVGEGIREISERMFYGCSSLTSVSVPATVREIGPYAFSSCPALREVQIAPDITEIGEALLYDSPSAVIVTPEGGKAYAVCSRLGLPIRGQDNP